MPIHTYYLSEGDFMSIAQLSPIVVVANPTNVNPLAHSTSNVAAAYAGSVAQQKSTQAKSDSVTISRQALEKAAKYDAETGEAKNTQTGAAPQKSAAPK